MNDLLVNFDMLVYFWCIWFEICFFFKSEGIDVDISGEDDLDVCCLDFIFSER